MTTKANKARMIGADKGTGQLWQRDRSVIDRAPQAPASGNAPASATPPAPAPSPQRQLRHLQITLHRLHRHLPPVLLHRESVFLNHARILFAFPLRYRMARGKKFPPPTPSNTVIIHAQY